MHLHVVQEPHYIDGFETRERSPSGSGLGTGYPPQNQPPQSIGQPEAWGGGGGVIVDARNSISSRPEAEKLGEVTVDYKIKTNTGTESTTLPQTQQPMHLSDEGEEGKTESPSSGRGAHWDPAHENNDHIADGNKQTEGAGEEDSDYGDMRIAVLVPYSGPGLPVWFDAFTDLAAANSKIMDWIIFCEEVR